MSESAALLAAIRQAPDDDAQRLIYAHWLDEHGQPERAEFIRMQIELARHETPGLRKRETELLAEHYDRFARPFNAPHLRIRFHRGFADGFDHAGVFVEILADHPPELVFRSSLFRFFADGRVQITDVEFDPNVWRESAFDESESVHSSRYWIDHFPDGTGSQLSLVQPSGQIERFDSRIAHDEVKFIRTDPIDTLLGQVHLVHHRIEGP